jgi:hypothetical protein
VTSSLGLGWFKLHAVAVASRTGHRRGEAAAARAGSRRGIVALARLPPESRGHTVLHCTAVCCCCPARPAHPPVQLAAHAERQVAAQKWERGLTPDAISPRGLASNHGGMSATLHTLNSLGISNHRTHHDKKWLALGYYPC